MTTTEKLRSLMEKLQEEDWILTNAIRVMTSRIIAHQEKGIRIAEMDMRTPDERKKYHEWLSTSFELHHKRSDLKSQQDRIRNHIQLVSERLEKVNLFETYGEMAKAS